MTRARAVASKVPERVREHNLTLVAAGVAFYAFLALIPALIAFVSIYGLFSSPENVKRQVEDISSLPKEVHNFLVYQLTQIVNASHAGVSIAAVVAAAAAFVSVIRGSSAQAATRSTAIVPAKAGKPVGPNETFGFFIDSRRESG